MISFASNLFAGEIRLLLLSLTDLNSDAVLRELSELVDSGVDGCIFVLQACLNEVEFNPEEFQNSPLKRDLLSNIFRYCLEKSHFSACFCEALGTTPLIEQFLETLSNAFNLSSGERIGIGLALSDSENPELRLKGHEFAIAQIKELFASRSDSLSNDKLHEIIVFLYRSSGLAKHMDTFNRAISILKANKGPYCVPFPYASGEVGSAVSLRNLELYSGKTDKEFDSLLAEIENEMSMADIITELGYDCTSDSTHFKDILSHFHPLDDMAIAKLIGSMACGHSVLGDLHNTYVTFVSAIGNGALSDSSQLHKWNIDVLVDSIREMAPETNWVHVMENLDHEGFNVPDMEAFNFVVSVYKHACQDPFPLQAVCGGVWKNAEGQLSFLKHAVSASADLFTFAHCSRQLAFAEFADLKHGNQAWFCLDLLEVLCQIAEQGYANLAFSVLDYPLESCPDLLLVGIANINTPYNLLQTEISDTVFPVILKDPSKISVVNYLWGVNQQLVLREFISAHTDPECLLRTSDICKELKILSVVLDSTPLSFSIKLAFIAYRNEQMLLEKWLIDGLNRYREVFFEECIEFLKSVLDYTANDVADVNAQLWTVVSTDAGAFSAFFKVLQSHPAHHISKEELKRLHLAWYAKSQNGLATDAPATEGSPDEIEQEANKYFHQMFSGQVSIDAMVQMLARFKESSDRREQLIFECMIANLFEEYKFFPKYPEKQLKLAAVLLGSLIKHQLVTHLPLGIALRGVLDGLRKAVDSKMFMFGTTALEQFMDRLIEWPQYCNHILQISHLRGAYPELVLAIERALARIQSSQNLTNDGSSLYGEQHYSGTASAETVEASETSWLNRQLPSIQSQHRHQGFLGDRLRISSSAINPINHSKPLSSSVGQSSLSSNGDLPSNQKIAVPSAHQSLGVGVTLTSVGSQRPRNSSSSGPLRQPSYTTGFGAAINIETLVAAAEQRDTLTEAPPSEVQDKILFLINNISTSNMEAKAKEFIEVLHQRYFSWFAEYMVMKRLSIEPNFHDLYLKFFEKVNSNSLNKEVVKASYDNCKVLLRSERIKSSSEERSLLKNLGSWLGKFTIGRNLALRAKEIDPKALIVEAYEKGLMIAVIPFTSKILEPCNSSIAYRPPNPWTMGILSLLAEIYNLPNLKMNLKFDIEVLFKNLSVDMKEVKPTSLLKDRVRETEGNPDFSNKEVSASQSTVISEVSSGLMPTLSHIEIQPELSNTSRSMSLPNNLPNVLNQYTTAMHFPSNAMVEDDKAGGLSMPDQGPTVHNLASVSPSPSQSPTPSFSLNQLMAAIPRAGTYFRINPKLSSMDPQLQYNKILELAMDKAVREIITPVIHRSVTIASRTTKELVLKDYAMESDDSVILRSANLMVSSLAGSLAHVTCKEPLRVSLTSQIRTIINPISSSTDANEFIIQLLVNDNLDLGCALIETVATSKARELIGTEVMQAFSQLRKTRESTGSSYYDAVSYTQGQVARLPEALRPKPGHLSICQQHLYEDFMNVWHSQSGQNSSAAATGSHGVSSASSQHVELASLEAGRVSPRILIGPGQIGTDNAGSQLTSGFSNLSITSNDLAVGDTSTKDLGSLVSLPSNAVDRLGTVLPEMLTTGEALERYHHVFQKLEVLLDKDCRDVEVQAIIAEVPEILLRCVSRDEAALAIAQKVFRSLYENSSNGTRVACLLAVLVAVRDVCKLVVKQLTSWVIYSDEEKKFNIEITMGLIRSELLNIGEYNVHLAKLVDGGKNKAATDFAILLLQTLVAQEPGVSMSELYNLLDALTKIATKSGSPESLQQLIDIARNNVNNATAFSVGKEEKTKQLKEKKALTGSTLINKEDMNGTDATTVDPAGFNDQVVTLFSEWCQICDLPLTNDSAYNHFVSQLQQSGLLKGDDSTERFFRILTELAVAHSLVSEQTNASGSVLPHPAQQPQNISYFPIDSYAKLVVVVMKHPSIDAGLKFNLLTKIISVTARVIQKDAEEKKINFNPRPFYRLFVTWLPDLSSLDPLHEGATFQVLTSFANFFHAMQPLRVPGWSYAWLELISHRYFMPKLLLLPSQKGWPSFQRLLVDLFKFMEPYLRNHELAEAVHFLYKGTLRVLLVLLHDFPEFLCSYHFSFCDVIPAACIQMRNVILSASPRNVRVPDPAIPNLKIDLLPEITMPPLILSDVEGIIKAKQIKADLDDFIKNRSENSQFLSDLKQKLLLSPSEANAAGTRYNIPLINSLVLYSGMQAMQLRQQNKPAALSQLNQSPMDMFLVGAAMDLYQYLVRNLDSEGRYHILNAIANQLRYPNSHTHYYSFIILYLFAEANQEVIQEQIARVLVERLRVNRPHPWGLVIALVELIKNHRYGFYNRSFTRATPDIEKLFESIALCAKGGDDGMVLAVPDGAH